VHPTTRSLIGTPASATATDDAVRLAILVPASASSTCMNTSTSALGSFSSTIAEERASETTFDISMVLLSGPGRFLSSTEYPDILYLALTIALSIFWACFGYASLTYTATIILFAPHSINADPSARSTTPV